MNQQMFIAIVTLAGVVWVVAVGFGVMSRGFQGGAAVFWWPFRLAFRLLRWAVASVLVGAAALLVSLANAVRGGGGNARPDRRRH